MPQPFELDDTRPPAGPSPLVSVEEARLFHSVRSRLFDGREDPLRLGTYRVLRRLGGGGMGEVFLAHDDELDRPVALKLVHARLGHDDHFAARMRREARALARLAHPNVVHVYEVGEHQGRVFIAMEYVQGQSLAGWIRDHAPRWQAVLDAYLAAGEGLAAAHAAGLTHRDFKPDNVLRGADGRVRVADFGLAHVEGGATDPPADTPASDPSGKHAVTLDQRLSATGGVMGTLDYMPLEQVRGGTVDARSDQFAFCVALYAGLWGRLPHAAASLGDRERVLVEVRPAVPPPAVVPGWVWPIVQRGLARDPAQRWPDMRTLLDRLRRTPVRRRARRRAVGTLLGLSLAAGGGWAALAPAPLCTPDASALAGTWDEPRRLAVRAAFTATGERFADESAARVERSLDAWAAKWTAARAENCAASRIQGVQSESTLDRRTACLERQRREVGALVTTLAHADARAVARAGEALRGLPELGACSVQAIDAQAEPVVAPTDRDAVDAGYDALGAAHSALNLGQVDLAVEQRQAWRGRSPLAGSRNVME
jgi:eukaryotic-like serine/threonine-protein kinase